MAERITLQDKTLEKRVYLSRLLVGGIIAFLLVMLLIARLIFLQVVEHDYYSTKSDNYRIHVQSVAPTRGLIYDRNGVLLAENIPSFSLMMVKENAGDIDEAIELISMLIELDEDDKDRFFRRLNRSSVPFSSVLVRMNLSEEEIARISVNQFRLPGIRVEAQLVRHYPLGEPFAHSVGYLGSLSEDELNEVDTVNYSGTNQIGKTGVERFYEDVLHGQVGYETVEKNARGQIMKVLERNDPVPGQDIVLHLDSQLQLASEEILGDRRGAIVALDVSNGGVLTMVSKPGFDPNLFVQGMSQQEFAAMNDPIQTPLYNRALASYSPGSTVKPFIGLAALDYNLRSREFTVADPGYFNLPGDEHVYHDWTWWANESGHGSVNLEKAIYQSCDIYFYDLAVDMDIDQMHDFMYRFGFGRNTAIDIPSARTGILPSRAWKRETRGQVWYPGETLNSSIGQGYTQATPLQLATATMVLANQGVWHQPALLRSFGLQGEEIINESGIEDVILNNFSDWEFVQGAMEMVVHKGNGGYRNNGTAYPYIAMINEMDYHMAGKSGTAQVIGMSADFDSEAEVPERYRDHALFIAFAPVDKPEVAVAVFVEHGEGGSSVAGPIAHQVVDVYMSLNDELNSESTQLSLSGGVR